MFSYKTIFYGRAICPFIVFKGTRFIALKFYLNNHEQKNVLPMQENLQLKNNISININKTLSNKRIELSFIL